MPYKITFGFESQEKHNINYAHKRVRPDSDMDIGIIVLEQRWRSDHGNTINVPPISIRIGHVHVGIGV